MSYDGTVTSVDPHGAIKGIIRRRESGQLPTPGQETSLLFFPHVYAKNALWLQN